MAVLACQSKPVPLSLGRAYILEATFDWLALSVTTFLRILGGMAVPACKSKIVPWGFTNAYYRGQLLTSERGTYGTLIVESNTFSCFAKSKRIPLKLILLIL